MKEQDQVIKLFSDQFEGTPWIDVNILSTLEVITAKEAATKPFPDFNSIWEIVNHMIRWRETVLQRIQGENISSPDDNYFSFIRDRSETEWRKTLEHFGKLNTLWVNEIKKIKRKDLDAKHEFSAFSNYELMHGILQHDAYHLGQIRLLKKMIQLT